MRINPNTGEIVSRDNDFCPNCDGELMDYNYPYCERCDEYVGIVVNNYSYFNQDPPIINNNDSNDNSLLTRGEKTCCGMFCFIIFLLWFLGTISRY